MNPKSEIKIWSHQQFQMLLVTLMLTATLRGGYAAPGDVDLSFDPGSTVNGPVHAVLLQPDGKLLIGGEFTTVHGAMHSYVARLNGNGSPDGAFALGVNLVATKYIYTYKPIVNCLAIQGDGKILIGGSFASTNGNSCTNIARLFPDGSPDDSFAVQAIGPAVYPWPQNVGGTVVSIIMQEDGKILLFGGFTSVNGTPRTGLARLNADGTLDPTFHPDLGTGQFWVIAAALQGDGKILIAGNFQQVNGVARNYLARLNTDGTLDNSFVSGMSSSDSGSIRSIVCLTNGEVLIGGTFSSVNGAVHNGIARLNANGSCDTNFQADTGYIFSIAVQPDGKVIVGGAMTNVVIRLNSDGSADPSFTGPQATIRVGPSVSPFEKEVLSLALQDDGKIILGASFYGAGYFYFGQDNLARLNSDGSLDSSWKNGPAGPNLPVGALAVQPDQKILIGGSFAAISGTNRYHLARLNADGSLDTTFLQDLTGVNGWIDCLALQSDGKILVAGNFTSVNGVTRTNIARLNSDGSLDTTFLQGLSGVNISPTCLTIQNDGKILIGGYGGVARLNTDGSLDTSFHPALYDAYDDVMCVAFQSDGKILIGGYFSSINRVIRLNTDGSLDTTFVAGIAESMDLVASLAVQNDGRILIGGQFASVNGIPATNVARLLPDGSLDRSFNCSGPAAYYTPGQFCASIGIQRDGKVITLKTTFRDEFPMNAPANNLFRLNVDGSADNSFLVDFPDSMDGVQCLALQTDGKFLIGGAFSVVNQTPRSFLARLMGEYAPPAITAMPQSATAEAGAGFSLPVRATGGQPLTYQWFFNETNQLDGCTNRCLELTNVRFSDLGNYTVVISNAAGSVTSEPAVLNVIPRVERRPVPALSLLGETGSALNVEYADAIGSPTNWLPLDTVDLTAAPQFYFDISAPLPPQRFYRVWQTGTPVTPPSLNLPFLVPAITLTGNIGDQLRLDCINQFGPTDAWVNLDTVTLTNTSQLYFDLSAPGQPRRLYRIVPVP